MSVPRTLVIAALLSAGCGGSVPMSGTYDRCVRDGEPNRVRTGTISDHGTNVEWNRNSGYREPLFTITETRESCEHTVAISGPNGVSYENGPYRWVSYDGARGEPLTIVYTAAVGSQAVVVTNGVQSEIYDRIAFEPRFSQNGQHIAYVGSHGNSQVVVVDGTEQMRHHGIERVFKRHGDLHMSWFDILDDGRALVVAAEVDDKLRVFVGGRPSAALFDDVPEQRLSKSPNGTRFAFRARLGHRNVMVVDGAVVDVPGEPGKVEWSETGDAYAFVVRRARVITGPGEPSQPAEGYVLEGQYTPLEGAIRIGYQKGHWLVHSRDPSTITVLGVPTPQQEPTDDQYKPTGSRAINAVRVRIGDSLGPVFDSIETRSIQIEAGVVTYHGERNKRRHRVVNNVIAKPEQQ